MASRMLKLFNFDYITSRIFCLKKLVLKTRNGNQHLSNPYFYDFNDHTWGWLVKITLVFVGLISACRTGCWRWHCPQPHSWWLLVALLVAVGCWWLPGGCCVLKGLGIPLHFKVCRLWLSEKVNLSPQPHAYGFSPVCLLICLFKEFWKTYSSSYSMMKLSIGLEFGGVWIYAYKKLFSKLKGAKKVEDLMKDFLQNTKFCSIVKIPGNWTSVHKHHRRILRGCSLELSPFLSRDFSSACPTTAASWKLQSIDDRGKSRRFLGQRGVGQQIQS